ncbi:MAG: glutamate formimidoyltransferase [Candidatus Poseidoniales archaeon]|jgi:glutamate formiminotransferase/formiminotetrahydrofolate cyclodeaminase|nr:glutamate formimidoyltransferase [Candidatus Poseidoniales archaeon]|tara:strand:+ start:2922 stop:3968 length:1047 start_codon:yes stop_codon:yes gene_type:complete
MDGILIECVPNISEGKDLDIIESIVNSARSVDGVFVLGCEPDSDYNRTVITIAGNPKAVTKAAYQIILKSSELIDMRNHTGNHPRMGAVDVCPFVPLSDNSMKHCIESARELSNLLGPSTPHFFYGEAASAPSRKPLSALRKLEYEGLESRFQGGPWNNENTRMPDSWSGKWGELESRFGAVAIGARNILVAYNVNVDEMDARASKIAGSMIRTSGRLIKNGDKKFRIPGMLNHVQGMGVPLPSSSISQVSMNLQNVSETSMHMAFEAVRSIVNDHGVKTCGSELVGLVPLSAMIDSGKWFNDNPENATEKELVESAIIGLGLDFLKTFDPQSSIIEWAIEKEVNNNE